eukprot:Cvel_28626.t1-p1 / transcript=Cvel_28626.t1 / gene=Cvel_28626 / organism=Chromera_velia_CCMP2878 / gene_product=hypothetical protein / transcript_product=hypothetical protein / location=Cvel_scaffold3781:215-4133(-) / protein_length=525 / sequence_SO=supercontig / SO=protein_coding / is_pseudo=false
MSLTQKRRQCFNRALVVLLLVLLVVPQSEAAILESLGVDVTVILASTTPATKAAIIAAATKAAADAGIPLGGQMLLGIFSLVCGGAAGAALRAEKRERGKREEAEKDRQKKHKCEQESARIASLPFEEAVKELLQKPKLWETMNVLKRSSLVRVLGAGREGNVVELWRSASGSSCWALKQLLPVPTQAMGLQVYISQAMAEAGLQQLIGSATEDGSTKKFVPRVVRLPSNGGLHKKRGEKELRIAMQALEGGVSLDVWARRLPEGERLLGSAQFVVQMAETLRRLHALRVLHCDLNPQNILVLPPEREGGPPRFFLLDFSDAVFLLGSRKWLSVPKGTRGFRAPELIRAASRGETDLTSFSPALDAFVLGVLAAGVIAPSALFRWGAAGCRERDPERPVLPDSFVFPQGTPKLMSWLLVNLLRHNAEERLPLDVAERTAQVCVDLLLGARGTARRSSTSSTTSGGSGGAGGDSGDESPAGGNGGPPSGSNDRASPSSSSSSSSSSSASPQAGGGAPQSTGARASM